MAGPASPPRHHPSPYTLAWLAVSLPLVVWDTAYVLGRPHTMPGGRAHWPLWQPYGLYGEVDYVYGWKAVHDRNGFTAAQSALNVAETALYLAYLCLWRRCGRANALALLLGFAAAVMTLSKTLLYWCNEYFSGFANVGHNDLSALVFLWIIPNGAWIVGSAYMVLSMGTEILDKLTHTAQLKSE
ncbi:hypothetical protein E4U21_004244 [Claviceps maximensis]|nr:hypothetical protein E4U21_004244 [Claviceps maximensis]